MAITTFSSLLPAMKPQLPGCEENLILQHLQLAMREFCLETEAYIVERSFSGVADQKDYTISAPSNTEVLRIFEVRVRSEDEVTDSEDGTVQNHNGYEYELLDENLKFQVAPFSEDITDGLVVETVLAPLEDYTGILDTAFLTRWSRGIQNGALFNLQSMPDVPWASPGKAGFNYLEFRKQIGYARREVSVQFTSRTLQMGGRSFL